jgi:hypothetical protein
MGQGKTLPLKALLMLFLSVSLLWVSLVFVYISYSSATDDAEGVFKRVYAFYIQVGDFQIPHKLYVSVPLSLYNFYRGESHLISGVVGYSKFITSEAVRPIAECIREAAGENNESFANAVLTIVQQMSYIVSHVKYPVETLVDGCGDCDVLSLLAASIMKSGGLDVVLFYYGDLNPAHVNVGIHLVPSPSHTWWTTPTCFEHDGKRYWVAECTPKRHWKIGEQPKIATNAMPLVITLDKYEGKSPARVSASLDKPLKASSISASMFLERLSTGENSFTVFGSISPTLAKQPVVIYVSRDEESWRLWGETFTDDSGNYSFRLAANLTRVTYFKTSWSGASGYAGSDSTTITLLVEEIRGETAPIRDLSIPRDPVLRAQLAMILKLFQLLNRSFETRFFKPLGSGVPTMFSEEFAVLRKGKSNYTFGFILSGVNVNYSVNVQLIDGKGVFQIVRQTVETEKVLVKVPVNLEENIWYEIEVNVSEKYLMARLFEGGEFLKGIGVKWQNISVIKFGVFMFCDGSTLALKNFKAETLNEQAQASENIDVSGNASLWLLYLLVFFALVISLAIPLGLKETLKRKDAC